MGGKKDAKHIKLTTNGTNRRVSTKIYENDFKNAELRIIEKGDPATEKKNIKTTQTNTLNEKTLQSCIE